MKKAVVVLYVVVIVLAVWLSYACFCNLSFDPDKSAGLLVSALGVMVTALVGWQVFNAIENVKTLKRMNCVQSRFEKQSQLLETQDKRLSCLIEAFAQDRKGDSEDELSSRYLCYLNAIHGLILANIPGANLHLLDTEMKLEKTLSDIENSDNTFSRNLFVSQMQSFEVIFREIITNIHQRQEDLESLHTRIIRLRDERKRVCESILQHGSL